MLFICKMLRLGYEHIHQRRRIKQLYLQIKWVTTLHSTETLIDTQIQSKILSYRSEYCKTCFVPCEINE